MAKHYCLLITGICLAASTLSARGQQDAVSRSSTETTPAIDRSQQIRRLGPSLDQTLTFLDDSLKPEEGNFWGGHGCKVATAQLSSVVFVEPQDPEGWHVYRRLPLMDGFSLADIDPESIESIGAYSIDFIKAHKDENPHELGNGDLTLVFFKTRNERRDIRFGSVPDTFKDGDYVKFDQSKSSESFVFHQQERAERFVTALKHAVVICGGKASDFARTPGIR